MNTTITLDKHETVIDKLDLEELQRAELNIPIFMYEGTEGWYTYDEVKGRHLLIYNALHGLSEKRIINMAELKRSNNNGITWISIQS